MILCSCHGLQGWVPVAPRAIPRCSTRARSSRRRLELLETVDEAERPGVEERELLLDRNREVGDILEGRAGAREHLLVAEPLLVAHAPSLLAPPLPARRSAARRRACAPA